MKRNPSPSEQLHVQLQSKGQHFIKTSCSHSMTIYQLMLKSFHY